MTVYPNPADDEVVIINACYSVPDELNVYDQNGHNTLNKRLTDAQSSGRWVMDTGSLKTGADYIEIVCGSSRSLSRLLIFH